MSPTTCNKYLAINALSNEFVRLFFFRIVMAHFIVLRELLYLVTSVRLGIMPSGS